MRRVMNGINAPKVLECKGSDGRRYRQLAKSGNDDLRQDAVRFEAVCFFFATKSAELFRNYSDLVLFLEQEVINRSNPLS